MRNHCMFFPNIFVMALYIGSLRNPMSTKYKKPLIVALHQKLPYICNEEIRISQQV